MRSMLIALLAAVLCTTSGCCRFQHASRVAGVALPGSSPLLQDTLFFGTSRKAGPAVTSQEWQAFLDQVVTPRFPDGLTVLDGAGQWRDGTGAIAKEASKVLIILHPATPDATPRLDEIISEYKRRFQQESVLLLRVPVTGRF